MSSHHANHAFLLLMLLSSLQLAAGQFSTLAISHVPNATLVCALLLPGSGADDGGYKLDCTSLPDGQRVSYPSADIPYSAIVAGSDFLCGLMAPAGGHAAMRWWSFSDEAAANRSRPVGRRLYWGPSLTALSAGGSHVCGLSDFHGPTCWEWPDLSLPSDASFSQIALGKEFVCGIAQNETLQCFGGDGGVTRGVPAGRFETVAAGWRHACAVDVDGAFVCWGNGRPAVPEGELPRDMWSMALGDGLTCILTGNGSVRCWGPAGAVPVPEEYAGSQFVAIEAEGHAVCGVLVATYAVVCWGSKSFQGRHLVYNDTMPGACAPRLSCPCDVFPGSGMLCGDDDYAVCHPCTLPLTASRFSIGNRKNTTAVAGGGGGEGGGRSRAAVVALGVAGVGLGVLTAVGLAFYLVVSKKWDKKAHVTVRLGDSSRGLCRDVEGAVMPAPQGSPPPARALGCEEFALKELARVTGGFSEEKKVGSGSFGSVYRARLADGREVAVKRAERAPSGARRRRRYDSERAFRAELKLLSRVNHRNLVQLIGFCEERGERILVFEFVSHGALHDHLHGQCHDGGGYSPLFASWEARLRVALDAARGVEYLHCYAVPPVIHRDIKPSNILLDAEWTAKVSDFGLSLASAAAAAAAASATAGTVGYMDPEYYRLQELTERSDVYSFGVVLLELLTGRKAIHRTSQDGSSSPRNIVQFAIPAVEAGDIATVLDARVPPPRGNESEAVDRVARVAAECVRVRGRARPVMSEVVAELEWAIALCEEAAAVRAAVDWRGSDLPLSRSESDDLSPFHTRELGIASGRLCPSRAESYSFSRM